MKRKLGMTATRASALKRKKSKLTFHQAVLRPSIQKNTGDGINTIQSAFKTAQLAIRKAGGRRQIKIPRVLPIKQGGFLPLLPLIFGGLSALGALSGGAAGIAKAVNDAKQAKKNWTKNNVTIKQWKI